MMQRVLLVAGMSFLAMGCVSKTAYDEAQVQLEECRQDKQAAQQSAGACEGRYDREVAQWERMETMVSDALPKSIEEFKQEREEILELVPEAARQEVETYLEQFTTAVAAGFNDLKDDNQRLFSGNQRVLAELEDARIKLGAVEDQTRSIDEMVGDTLEKTRASRNRMRAHAANIVRLVQAFDRDRVSDRDSSSRLKLNRTERETISLFHSEVISELTALQQEGGATEPESGATEADEDSSDG